MYQFIQRCNNLYVNLRYCLNWEVPTDIVDYVDKLVLARERNCPSPTYLVVVNGSFNVDIIYNLTNMYMRYVFILFYLYVGSVCFDGLYFTLRQGFRQYW